METKEYELLDGRIIRAKYDRLNMCKISQENLEAFVKEFNASYRQAKILEKIKENYALMKLDERKKGKWIKMPLVEAGQTYSHECSLCGRRILVTDDIGLSEFPYCHCGAEMEAES